MAAALAATAEPGQMAEAVVAVAVRRKATSGGLAEGVVPPRARRRVARPDFPGAAVRLFSIPVGPTRVGPFRVPAAGVGRKAEAEEGVVTVTKVLLLVRLAPSRALKAILAQRRPEGPAALVTIATATDAAEPSEVEIGL